MANNRELSQFANTVGYDDGSVGIGTDKPLDPPHASNTKVLSVGIVTANYLYGDGSNLTNVSGGGGASAINDLSDAVTYDSGSGIGLGGGALANDDGTDNYNTALGYNALNASTSGNENVAIGYSALCVSTTGYENTAVGYQAGDALTSGQRNVFVGMGAATNLTSGHTNVAVGRESMLNSTTSAGNVAVGDRALRSNTTGSNNTALGYNAMWSTNSGGYNVAVGYQAGEDIGSGYYNSFVGMQAGQSGGGSGYCAAVGYRALRLATSYRNTALGYQAGDSITSGNNNIVIGYDADATSATTSNEITLGNTDNNKFRIPGIGITFGDNTTLTDGHVLTYSSSTGEIALAAASGGGSTGVNTDAQNNHYGIDQNVESFSGTDATDNTLFGHQAGYKITTGDKNVVIGSLAGDALTSGGENVYVGYNAGSGENTQSGDVAIGAHALSENDGQYNVAVGFRAGTSNGSSSDKGVYLGYWAGPYVSGDDNISIGNFSMGGRTTSGSDNIAIGRVSGYDLGAGQNNTFVGDATGYSVIGGDNNTFIGDGAGFHFDNDASSNIAIGRRAGYNVDGNNNTIIGSMEYAASTTMNGEIAIGAGTTERLRVDSNGNVGIGTDNPPEKLSIENGNIFIRDTSDNASYIYFTHSPVANRRSYIGAVEGTGNSNSLVFATNGNGLDGSERLRITSDGDLRLGWNNNNFLGSYYDDDYYMGLSFGANNRELYIDNRANDTRADIVFRTVLGQSTPTERLRITSDGKIGIGNTMSSALLTIGGNSDEVSTPSIRLLDGTDTREVSISNSAGDFVASTHGTDDAIHGRIKIFESGVIDFDTGGASGTLTNRFRIDADGYRSFSTQPYALLRKDGTSQNITADAFVRYDETVTSEGGMTVSTNKDRITVPKAGKYAVFGAVAGSNTTVSVGDGWRCEIWLNGSVYSNIYTYPINTVGASVGEEYNLQAHLILPASANDYFEIRVASIGSARASVRYGYFCVYYLG